MRADQSLHHVAYDFLKQHQGAYLEHQCPLLLNRCIAHVSDTHSVSARVAEIATLQAYGDYMSSECKAYVDVSHTTSHAVLVRDPINSRLLCFTVAELVELVSTRAITCAEVGAARQPLTPAH